MTTSETCYSRPEMPRQERAWPENRQQTGIPKVQERSPSGSAKAKSVVDLVAFQASIRPEAPAICCSQRVVSYGDLENRANELALTLAGLGAGPEQVVGLLTPRSAAMVVGALGILKSGAAYLPLDPTYPENRLSFQLEDAQVPVLVRCASAKVPARSGKHETIVLDDGGRILEAPAYLRKTPARTAVSPDNLAYVIYTSGSTGKPKGVEVTHSSLCNLVEWHRRTFKVSDQDRASQVARVGFDAAVWEIWPYLASGASLHQPPEDLLSQPEALQHWLLAQEITVTFIPTPLAERLLALPWPAKTSLRFMLTGGDALHGYTPKDVPFSLINNYGPTECTVVATSAPVPVQGDAWGPPPIGWPIQNTRVYILDQLGNPVPEGGRGELYIGGAGLARGYRNQPELTKQRFLHNPFSRHPGERFFKTGDLVRCLPDGQLAFLGRADDQLKIRGFRIEPDEIAAALNEHPAILQSVVAGHEVCSGDLRLVGYFIPRSADRPSFGELHEFLSARLPEFMVPGIFVALDHLPLTPNGKVDRAALPAPTEANTLREAQPTAPRTEAEAAVAQILQELLGVQSLGVEDNFFALGGHSLLGTQLISKVRQAFGVSLTLRDVFEAPTAAGIAARIEQRVQAQLEAMSEEQAGQLLNSASLAQ